MCCAIEPNIAAHVRSNGNRNEWKRLRCTLSRAIIDSHKLKMSSTPAYYVAELNGNLCELIMEIQTRGYWMESLIFEAAVAHALLKTNFLSASTCGNSEWTSKPCSKMRFSRVRKPILQNISRARVIANAASLGIYKIPSGSSSLLWKREEKRNEPAIDSRWLARRK